MAETMAQAIERRRREREAIENEEWAQRNASREPVYAQHPVRGLGGALREAALQTDAAVRSAADSVTLGGATRLAAGLDALVPADGHAYAQRYAERLAAYRARDQYDAVHRRMAQEIGAGGTLALSLFGGEAPLAARLIQGAATRSAPETAAILGAGGLSGMGWQDATDAAAHRRTDWRDDVGAFAGGVAGGGALPLGPGKAAAVQAATTTAIQSVLHGRPPSPSELARSAAGGRAIGAAAGAVGRNWSNGLSMSDKGELGETLGWARSAVNGLPREAGPKQRIQTTPGKPGTIPDGRSGDVWFEDKFGPSAQLSGGQRVAQQALGDHYIVYHFLPEDVAKALGISFAGMSPQALHALPPAPPPRPASRRLR